MKKCVWCSETITERRGFKEIPMTALNGARKGWAHGKCYREWFATVCFELPGDCVDKDGKWIGWVVSGNHCHTNESFALVCGPLGSEYKDRMRRWTLLPMLTRG